MFNPITQTPSSKLSSTQTLWIGRFAPSPTGSLHFGSLVAAVASFLIAKAKNGLWLLRIEDLDPPREKPGSAEQIIETLDYFHLKWDGPIVYQSQRHEAYQKALNDLMNTGHTYYCDCSRKWIQKQFDGIYPGHCKTLNKQKGAIRIIQDSKAYQPLKECIQKAPSISSNEMNEDFIIKRRDDLFAYQLAVVCDDIDSQVNHIVRGTDLLSSSIKQQRLYQLLDYPTPVYYHIPVATDTQGRKLSKHSLSPAISQQNASQWLYRALTFLNHQPPASYHNEPCNHLLDWAQTHWNTQLIPAVTQRTVDNEGRTLSNLT